MLMDLNGLGNAVKLAKEQYEKAEVEQMATMIQGTQSWAQAKRFILAGGVAIAIGLVAAMVYYGRRGKR